MSYKKDRLYRDIPFSSETPHEDFFFNGAVSDLYAKCETNKNKVIKIRTVGILQNKHGCFYIKEIIAIHDREDPPDPRQGIQVSMAYMNTSVRCASMQYPVQLFGRLQWCDRPVIFAQIMQPLSVSAATLLHETVTRICTVHSARQVVDSLEVQ